MKYLAHRTEDDGREQTIFEHLRATAKLAEEYAEKFGAADAGKFCGVAHDLGKYSEAFQRRIRGNPVRVDHSSAGTLEALAAGNFPAAFVVAGHHGGMPDKGSRLDIAQESTLLGKSKRRVGLDIEDYSAYKKEICLPKAQIPAQFTKDCESGFFFTRMLYSCLVDADFLDTEQFRRVFIRILCEPPKMRGIRRTVSAVRLLLCSKQPLQAHRRVAHSPYHVILP